VSRFGAQERGEIRNPKPEIRKREKGILNRSSALIIANLIGNEFSQNETLPFQRVFLVEVGLSFYRLAQISGLMSVF
jgi:hypothetical protein